MIIVACSLYLPQHITFLVNRGWFYYFGDDEAASSAAAKAVSTSIGNAAVSTSVDVGRRVRDAAVESARTGRAEL